MDALDRSLLVQASDTLSALLRGGKPGEIAIPDTCCGELRQLCGALNRLAGSFGEALTFLQALSEGRLDVDAPPRNFFLSPFKQLHSNLRHLTWQTQQIAAGDLNQQVHFLGEFSDSFNSMIASLREKRAVEEALADSEKKLRDITSALGEGVFLLNTRGELTFMNPEAERLLGWKEAELFGKDIHDEIHKGKGKVTSRRECPILSTIKSHRTFRVNEDFFTRRDGSDFPVAYVSTPVMNEDRCAGAVTAFHDISELKKSREALQKANHLLEQLATTDALTGLANRVKFSSALSKEMKRSARHRLPLSLVMIDIDYFKRVNDTFGHQTGDLILQETANLISGAIRGEDMAARWGGEEFLLLLPHTHGKNGCGLAERLRVKVEGRAFTTVKNITCSFGVAELREGDTPESFINRADAALYRAKEGGRNRVVVYED